MTRDSPAVAGWACHPMRGQYYGWPGRHLAAAPVAGSARAGPNPEAEMERRPTTEDLATEALDDRPTPRRNRRSRFEPTERLPADTAALADGGRLTGDTRQP